MAAEVPVVSTRVAGIPELIDDGRTGRLVPERNAGALAAAIDGLLRDPEGRRALARAGRAAVRERFDRRRNIHRLVEIFDAHGGRGPRASLAPRARPDAWPQVLREETR
jgi:glycosyltransferase involved in cell wall biosynthesis